MKAPDRGPINHAAECALLGCFLSDPSTFAAVADLVRAEDLHGQGHAAIWQAVAGLHERREAVTVLGAEAELRRIGKLAQAGGMAALAECLAACDLPQRARALARLVRDEALRRQAAEGGARVRSLAWDGRAEPLELAQALAALARDIAARAGDVAGGIGDLVRGVWRRAEDGFEGRRARLDPAVDPLIAEAIPAIGAGEMLVIGGRPAAGKSNLAGDLAFGWARAGHAGLILTAEDSPEDWTARELAKVAGLDPEDVRSGRLDAGGWHALAQAGSQVATLPVRAEQMAGRRACDYAGRMIAAGRRGARWVVIDYVQLVRPTQAGRGASREEDTSSVVAELKAVAIEAGLALVLVSQLRRHAGPGIAPRPGMADLRNSGMLEAQADAVLLLWRPRQQDDYPRCRLILAKHKHGSPREVEVNWLPHRRKVYVMSEGRPALRDTDRD